MLKDKTQNILILWNLLLLLLIFLLAIIINQHNDFVYPALSYIIIVSIIYFLFLCTLSLKSSPLLFFCLPLCIITVPNAINDINIGYMMGPTWEVNRSSFSFFTHIDIFLWISIIRFSEKIRIFLPRYIIITAITFFFAQTIINLISYIDSDYFGSYLTGTYQTRYLFLLILLVGIYEHKNHFKHIYFGVLFASILLVIESLITTYLIGDWSRLTSGNFGVNVYGNLLAAIIVFLYLGEKLLSVNLLQKTVIFTFIILILIAVIATKTRGSLISILISTIFFYFIVAKNNNSFSLSKVIKNILMASVAIIMVTQLIQYLSSFSFQEIISDSYTYNEESTSLRSRHLMNEISFRIIEDNYLFGVGNSVWNRFKYEYNTPFSLLLDPHNDYLNYIVSYGVILGFGIIFFIYIYPLYKVFFAGYLNKKPSEKLASLYPFSLFILTISISSVSNSNTAKHQVFALFILFCLIIYRILNTKLLSSRSTISFNH